MDALGLKSHEHWESCGEKAQKDNRIILTKDRRHQRLAQYVGPDRCYALKSDKPQDQLREIFKHFHVVESKEHIFSRCMLCNSANFAKLTSDELRAQKANWKDVEEAVLDKHQVFYGCEGCKKIYWEGSHWERALRQE